MESSSLSRAEMLGRTTPSTAPRRKTITKLSFPFENERHNKFTLSRVSYIFFANSGDTSASHLKRVAYFSLRAGNFSRQRAHAIRAFPIRKLFSPTLTRRQPSPRKSLQLLINICISTCISPKI